jgi:hypothetical protein
MVELFSAEYSRLYDRLRVPLSLPFRSGKTRPARNSGGCKTLRTLDREPCIYSIDVRERADDIEL